jgi:hypothetical protein
MSPRVIQYLVTKRIMFYIDMTTRPIECTSYIRGPETIKEQLKLGPI